MTSDSLMPLAIQGFILRGYIDEIGQLAKDIKTLIPQKSIVLFKASRGIALEQAIAGLKSDEAL